MITRPLKSILTAKASVLLLEIVASALALLIAAAVVRTGVDSARLYRSVQRMKVAAAQRRDAIVDLAACDEQASPEFRVGTRTPGGCELVFVGSDDSPRRCSTQLDGCGC
jgi:hypothetical protein